jgi:dipeptidyl aminopeptidase/acylaminoacyl peptidase
MIFISAANIKAAQPIRANGKIAFSYNFANDTEIYVINSDGSGLARLTNSADLGKYYPAWSPDGSKIAFLSLTGPNNYELKLMNADGSNQTTLTTVNPIYPSRGIDLGLSWSPDGGKIAFNSNWDIFTINIDGSNLVNLTNNPVEEGEPAWSPDGSKIAFTKMITFPSDPGHYMAVIHLMNPDGSNVVPTENYGWHANKAHWSPDGERFAYLFDKYQGPGVGLLAISDGGILSDEYVWSFDWSPDGRKFVLATYIGNAGLYLMNANGGTPTPLVMGAAGQPDWQPLLRTAADFDGDSRADISVFRPSDRTWYLYQSTAGFSATQFGLSTDRITPADYDADGRTDISVFRDGTWYWLNSSNGNFNAVQFGLADDIPVPADFTGDGRAELAVYRSGTWWTLDLTNNQANAVQFGLASDKPVMADYDGDGRADQAVYRNGEWHLNRSSQGYTVVQFGLASDKPVIGDYDGDGKTDQAVYRDGTWYLLRSSQGFAAFQFGLATDIPAAADYDGDGKTDAAVFRNGTWWILQSTNGFSTQQFGLTNDKPVPAAYLP